MPYFEILILAGTTATFLHEAQWGAYERMVGGLEILSLAGTTATFCATINFRNPEVGVSLGTNDKNRMRNFGGIRGKTWRTLTGIKILS